MGMGDAIPEIMRRERRLQFASVLAGMNRQERRKARRNGLFTARQEKIHLKELRRYLRSEERKAS